MAKGNMAENAVYQDKANQRDDLNVNLNGTQAEQK